MDCLAGKEGSGKVGTAGMSIVFAFFLGDCLLGITGESRSSSESSSSLNGRNLRFGLNKNLMMYKFNEKKKDNKLNKNKPTSM